MPTNSGFADIFTSTSLMAIMRGMGVERTLAVAQAAWDLGITVVEVPLQTPEDVTALQQAVRAADARGAIVGAGTITTVEQVAVAAQAGAQFTVSPGFDLEVVRASVETGLLPMPGVATATEVQLAMKHGLRWLKAFPASTLGSGWIKAMHGPFPDANFVATGGMDATNAREFLAAGARVVAVGSALEDPDQLPKLAEVLRK